MEEIFIPLLIILGSGLFSFLIVKIKLSAEFKKWEEERMESYRKKIMELRLKAFRDFKEKSTELELCIIDHDIYNISENEKSRKLVHDLCQIIYPNDHILTDKSFLSLCDYLDCCLKEKKKGILTELVDKGKICTRIFRDELGLKKLGMYEGLDKIFKK